MVKGLNDAEAGLKAREEQVLETKRRALCRLAKQSGRVVLPSLAELQTTESQFQVGLYDHHEFTTQILQVHGKSERQDKLHFVPMAKVRQAACCPAAAACSGAAGNVIGIAKSKSPPAPFFGAWVMASPAGRSGGLK